MLAVKVIWELRVLVKSSLKESRLPLALRRARVESVRVSPLRLKR